MARRTVLKIEGAKQLDDVLKQLPQNVARRALVPSLRSAAAVLRREIVARAPDGPDAPHPRYGELRKNITVTIDRRPGGFAAIIHTGRAFWARWLEYGRAAMTVRSKKVLSDGKVIYGRQVKAAPAQPFFRPAFDAKAQEALARLGERLGENIEKEAARLAGNVGRKRGRPRRR